MVYSVLIGVQPAFADIALNDKWTQDSNGKWSLTISPRGDFMRPEFKTVYCQAGYWPCEGRWQIQVGNQYTYCDPVVKATVGTPGATFMAEMTRAYNGRSCTLGNLSLNGTEKVCVKNLVSGEWLGTMWTLGYVLYSINSCEEGSVGGGGGIIPPVKPLSCSISNITLDHGTVDYGRLEASEANSSATVSCTRQATVKITVANAGKINLKPDGSFYSIVSVMGKPGGAQFLVNNMVQVSFSSRLYMENDEVFGGAFNGSAVVVLNVL